MSKTERVRPQPIRLPKLQHASLRAMGIEMPWIVVDGPPPDVSHTASQPASEDMAVSAGSVAPAVSADMQAPAADVRELVQAARDAVARTAGQRSRTGAPGPAVRTGPTHSEPAAPATPADAPAVSETALQDVRNLDMEALAAQISDCTRCDLSFRRTQAVCGLGAVPARVMVVGEAPGELDDSTGEPFAGQVGELLDNMLAAIGLDRDTSVYLTTVVKCRPPTNRTPTPDEIASCLPYFLRQLELVKPDVILALGQVAANTLLGSSHKPHGIGPLRNKVHETALPEGPAVPVVVTYNPLYLLGQPRYKERAWEDLKRVAGILRHPA